VLAYDSTFAHWRAMPVSALITLANTIGAMVDTNVATAAPAEVLTYSSDFDGAGNSGWVAAPLPAAIDAYTKTEVNGFLGDKANAADVYDKTTVDGLLGDKADAADVYDKTAIDNMLVYTTSTDANGDTVIDFTQP
jgi:hypothetical protein